MISTLVESIRSLPHKSRRRILLLVAVQVFLGALDLLAIGLAGILGTLAVVYVQSKEVNPEGFTEKVLSMLNIYNSQMQAQILTLALITSIIFLARTFFSIYFTRKALQFLGQQSAMVSTQLIEKLLLQPLTFLQTRTSNDFVFATTTSANALILGVLGTTVIMVADIALLIVVAAIMFYVAPIVALIVFGFLGILAFALHRITSLKALKLGQKSSEVEVESRNLILESIATYRDMRIRGSQNFYVNRVHKVRRNAADLDAEMSFIPNVSKYLLELAVILIALIVSLIAFALEDAQRAVGVLVIFLAAGARLGPAVIRLQQCATNLTWNIGRSAHLIKLKKDLPDSEITSSKSIGFSTQHQRFDASVKMKNVTYTYPEQEKPALSDFNLNLNAGEVLAIVGASGAGKSTAVDLLLGILSPQQGIVQISGQSPEIAAQTWPGAIGYVPQDVWIADKSVYKNLTLGFESEDVPAKAIWNALERSEMAKVVQELPYGLDTILGERGAKLSGGQRQRLGIARALLTEPKLLILDEATSALDSLTENIISRAIKSLHGKVTIIIIAHRLATVRNVDKVLFLEKGKTLAIGSFDDVRSQVPNFDTQAKLSGL